MTARGFGVAEGVGVPLLWCLGGLLAVWLLLLALEARGRRVSLAVALSGLCGALFVAAAVLRPTRVTTRGSDLFPKVLVLVDRSWRLGLKSGTGDTTREQLARAAVRDLQRGLKQARLEVLGFGEGAPAPFVDDNADGQRPTDSDLTGALRALSAAPGERPKAVVVISDGRLTSPSEGASSETLRQLGARLGVPIHTLQVGGSALPDASIRRVATTGAAVAHQKLALSLTVGCSGGLSCDELPITVEELLHGEPAALLAQGSAKVRDGVATIELPFTLDRAGRRLVRVKLQAPEADRIPENDQRLLTFDVTRERVRLLHVAGRPTYDVRALRMWLKADESIDLVAFFILRTNSDAMQADDSELALIPFPVDELFTEHLPSFDAVILQDIDAVEYKLERHLPALSRYVRAGGGLIMVGGPSAFMGGGYAGTPLAEVLPIALPEQGPPFDTAPFEPRTTPAGRAAPALRGVRELLGDALPSMQGSNTLGPLRPGAIALWEHPDRRAGNAPMPVLALGESGDGRAIALGVDGTHLLEWSELGERGAGRAYGALWEGLVGWLMRDPRYESARLDLTHECRAGAPVTLGITRLPGAAVDVKLNLERLGEATTSAAMPEKALRMEGDVETATVPLGALSEGGYSVTVRIGSAPPARLDFACERGGAAFADSRPDAALLERISKETGGLSLHADDAASLTAPPPTHVESQRLVAALLPPWVWALLAASGIGAHWYLRRQAGLV
jgi:uncharacterized membrane protein